MPPGYQRLPRTVRPNVPKIEALLQQLGWSKQHLAERCGRGDAGFIRHWEKPGATCYIRLLIIVAQELGLKHWWELWADYVPPPPPTLKQSVEEALIERLAVQTLLNATDELSETGTPQGSTSFFDQVIGKFPEETESVRNNLDAFKAVFTNLEGMEWLIANEDGTFSRRYWTVRECVSAIEFRCYVEEGAMANVANLRDPKWGDGDDNLALYEKIIGDQWALLKEMRDAHQRVVQKRDEDAAALIVKYDDAFHRRWPFTPCVRMSFDFSLLAIDQSTNRYIETRRRCQERDIDVPEDSQTLCELVQNYYPELENILTRFELVKPHDDEGMAIIRKMIRRHAYAGFDTTKAAETLIKKWPRGRSRD